VVADVEPVAGLFIGEEAGQLGTELQFGPVVVRQGHCLLVREGEVT